MDRPRARRILALALAAGLLAELVLDGPALGINTPILVAVVLAMGWVVRRRGRAPDPLDAWLPVAALLFAAFVAIRADPLVAALDVVVAGACTLGTMAVFSGLAVTRRAFGVLALLGVWLSAAVVRGAAPLARPAAPERSTGSPRAPWLGALGRGLVIGVPLCLIFAVLFASADPIFRQGFEDVLGLRIDLGDIPGRILFVLAVAWLVAGLLRVAATGVPPLETASLGAAARPVAAVPARLIGATEALVALLLVDAVVLLFVGLQVAYLFGGVDTLAAIGMTYSDYARRGFFELVAAAGLAAGLLVVLELSVRSRTRPYLVAAVGLVALTLVVLASAALRLQLYQDAYGWTELRLYVAITIVSMAVGLLVLVALLVAGRIEWIGHGLAGIGLVALLVLNLLAPAHFVAERNLARAADPSSVPADGDPSLDWRYLRALPDDAVPAMVQALPRLSGADAGRVRSVLAMRWERLAEDPAVLAPAAWNLARERARAALATVPDLR